MISKLKNIIIKIFQGIVIVVLVGLLALNILVIVQAHLKPNAVPSIFGYKPFIVMSSSMEREFFIGDLVIIQDTDIKSLKVNDIIAFRDEDDSIVTHRIKEKVTERDELCFKTKGDKNDILDNGIVCQKDIEGKYISRISNVGGLLLFIQEPLGFSLMMIIILIVGIFVYYIETESIDERLIIEDEEELKEFEEFKRMRRRRRRKKNIK